jgi:glutamate/tyrosine decarboxylase-like PLP-dependent enzyme
VERNVTLARLLGERLAASGLVHLLAPVRLNVVCFTLPQPERVHELASLVAEGGETFLTPTVYNGQPALRAAFSNWRTTEADVDRILHAITTACETL